MRVLVLNCGSSSLRFQVVDTDIDRIRADSDRCLVRGTVERIGSHSLITVDVEGCARQHFDAPLRNHRAAIDLVLRRLVAPEAGIPGIGSVADLHAVGHRVVHGGERFQTSVRIDDAVLQGLEDLIELAPLHNPANIAGIRAATELLGRAAPQVAVFDTAFHATMPATSYLYGIPYQHYRRHKIRRYGFHGTSHRYVAYRYRTLENLPKGDVTIVTLHLGHGASACAIRNGQSFDTSMGFTPQEGLLMATRAGDLDASILELLALKEGMTLAELDTMLNKQSGLLGVSGLTNDMRELLEEESANGDRRARLAIDLFCYRVRKYVGAYLAALGGAQAVCFAGGIGENAPEVRRRICDGLQWFGLELDPAANAAAVGGRAARISTEGSRLRAWVIPTNEELLIARDTYRTIEGVPMPR